MSRSTNVDAERELAFFRSCLGGMVEFLAVTDRSHRYVWRHDPCQVLGGAEAVGRTALDAPGGATGRALFDLEHRALVEQADVRAEVRLEVAKRTIEVVASPLHEAGECIGVRTVGYCVGTARQRDERREDHLRVLCHDLRQPLDVIGLDVQVLSHVLAELGTLRDRIGNSARQIDRSLEDFLDAGESESGELTLRREPLELSALVRDALASGLPAAALARVEVRADEPCAAVVDRSKLGRAVVNLVANALKFSPETDAVSVVVARAGHAARIEVQDRGCGIAASELAAVFDKYGASERSRALGGRGLGLYSTRLIVEAHGGVCRVVSEPGRGSTFSIELPIG